MVAGVGVAAVVIVGGGEPAERSGLPAVAREASVDVPAAYGDADGAAATLEAAEVELA